MMSSEYVVAKYLRISDDDGRYGESQSIEGQRALLDDYILSDPDLKKARVLEYTDDGWSGTNFNRPGVTELLAKTRSGGIQCILVKDFSRFGRSYIDVGDYLEQIFPFLRVRFVSVNDYFDSDRQECSAGDVSVAFKSLCNDYYSKDLSRKVRAGIASKWSAGKHHAAYAPYGYQKSNLDNHRLVLDEKTAPVVRHIFDMALAGISATKIAMTLNDQNIITPARYKAECTGKSLGYNTDNVWTDNIIYRLLHDVRYTGLLVQGTTRCDVVGSKRHRNLPKEQWQVSPIRHEAIISEEEFERVQASGSVKRQKYGPRIKHPLSGLVRCGGCGHLMERINTDKPSYRCRYKRYYDSCSCPQKGIKCSHRFPTPGSSRSKLPVDSRNERARGTHNCLQTRNGDSAPKPPGFIALCFQKRKKEAAPVKDTAHLF